MEWSGVEMPILGIVLRCSDVTGECEVMSNDRKCIVIYELHG